MYEIRNNNGDVVATVEFDPYSYEVKQENRSITNLLEDVGERKQMNRTAGGEQEGEGGTSYEGYQDPSPEFLLSELAGDLGSSYSIRDANRREEE
jgi:hypothetical protein